LILVLLWLCGCNPVPAVAPAAEPTVEIHPEFQTYFDAFQVDGTFVLFDVNHNKVIRYNPERCAERFIPASTFKILNTLIALETGVIPDKNYVIEWDGTAHPVAAWNQDHTLQTALQNSVVWYYQEIARRVGPEQMQHYVDTVGYGNQDISGKIDSFWLEGGLRISPDEQIEFLRRLYNNDLPFAEDSMDLVKDLLIVEQSDDYTLRAKTGWAQRVQPQIGWWVGYLERDGNVYFFATNIESAQPNADFAPAKIEITKNILRELALL
jgi:beta-lactamase class D